METRQTIKKRIKSIEGTRQITKTMRLVSIAKMQKARETLSQNQPFLEESRRLLAYVGACRRDEALPYLDGRSVQNSLMVLITGDRGLCGGYNVGLIRCALTHMDALGHPCKVIAIGAKAGDAFKRRQSYAPIRVYKGLSDSPLYEEVEEIAAYILDVYDQGEVDEILLCYARFSSMLVQNPVVERLLPVEEHDHDVAPGFYEPECGDMVRLLAPFYLASRLHGALLEAAVCEHSARILSMDGAARTAGEMILDLTLRYNRARQDAVTQEITEIIAGADASDGRELISR